MQEITRLEFTKEFKYRWQIGEHVTLVGATGDGKTVLAKSLYEMHDFVLVIATKSKDDSLDDYGKDFHRLHKWPPRFDQRKVLFWKRPGELGNFAEQRYAIYNVLNDVYQRGGYTVGLDDVAYLTDTLRLETTVRMLCTQARSQDISLVMNIQRPFRVPIEVTSQASHILIFDIKDHKDILRVAEGAGLDAKTVEESVQQLHKYDFVWMRKKQEPILVRNRE